MMCARSSSFKVLLNKVAAQNISTNDNVGATDDVKYSIWQLFTQVVSFPAVELATEWLQGLTVPFRDESGLRKR